MTTCSSEVNMSTCSQWWGHILRHFTETREIRKIVRVETESAKKCVNLNPYTASPPRRISCVFMSD